MLIVYLYIPRNRFTVASRAAAAEACMCAMLHAGNLTGNETITTTPNRNMSTTGLGLPTRCVQMAAAMLWKELRAPKLSFYAPYLATLPSRGEVWSYYNLPLQYLPFIHNTAMVGPTGAAIKAVCQATTHTSDSRSSLADDLSLTCQSVLAEVSLQKML